MKKYILLFFISITSSFAIEQTICFSKKPIADGRFFTGVLGDDVILYGGKCEEKKLADMNKAGWRLVQVVGGLDSSFGMVFERGK